MSELFRTDVANLYGAEDVTNDHEFRPPGGQHLWLRTAARSTRHDEDQKYSEQTQVERWDDSTFHGVYCRAHVAPVNLCSYDLFETKENFY